MAEIVWLFDRGTREATEAARSLAEGLVGTVDSTLRNEAVELGRVSSVCVRAYHTFVKSSSGWKYSRYQGPYRGWQIVASIL